MPLFKVIRASAGSGKTFNLTHEYLRLLLKEHDAFLHILAVTFTNKATEEMKSRIIRELFALSSDKPSKQLKGLIASTGLNEEQIRNKAVVILKKLLHHYSGFNVNTIDSFFQRIIRSFTRELGIQEGYAIELDTDLVLKEVIDRLLIQAEQDKALLSWLTQFAESLIEKGESWNLRKGIRELGNEIFKEEFKSLNDSSLQLFSDRNFLNGYKNELAAQVRSIEAGYRNFGLSTKEILESRGLIVEDFSNKNRGPAGFMVSLANGVFREPTATAINASISVEKWYTSGSPRRAEIIEAASQYLIPLLQQVIEYYRINSRNYFTASVILRNLYTLGILNDLSKIADTWCSENNTFLLTEAPGFLNKIIDGNDTPFIYEKAGYWFHHFMIDEFQDTSMLQWLNFKPLISNSLSQNYDNLAVGDTKQSIYRWRNSNWEILESRINQDFLPGIIDSVRLKENWRSRANIISFNNQFFSSAAVILQDEFNNAIKDSSAASGFKSIADLYSDMQQITGDPENTGGYVQVDYISNGDESDFYESVNKRVIDLVYELLEHGYHLNDIAILTRKNSEASTLADVMLKYSNARPEGKRRLEVISDEALRLGSSVVVNTIVSCLRYMINPSDQTNNYFVVSAYSNYLLASGENWINAGGKENSKSRYYDIVLPEDFRKLALSHESYSLIEITERIIKIFQLENHHGELVYLLAFRDLIIEFAGNFGSNIPGFIEYWDDTGKEKSVSAPSGQDALRIITLHKSKGLEFKITIIPYCTWELNTYNKTFLWCKPGVSPFDKLPVLPLTYNTQLQQTIFADDFFKEYYMQLVDNLNLLYVAFTRAQDAMYIFCRDRQEDQLKTVSDLSRKVLGRSKCTVGAPLHIPAVAMENCTEEIDFEPLSVNSISGRLKIAFQGRLLIDPLVNRPSRPLNEGKILHEIFTLIRTRNDIKSAVYRLHLQGKITNEDAPNYIRLIEHAMNDIQVSTWFTDDWNILTEAEIILPKGHIKRPDRIMFRNNQTVIIDYKFGSKIEPVYETQVKEYARLLKEMGYTNIEAYLWYVKLGRVLSL